MLGYFKHDLFYCKENSHNKPNSASLSCDHMARIERLHRCISCLFEAHFSGRKVQWDSGGYTLIESGHAYEVYQSGRKIVYWLISESWWLFIKISMRGLHLADHTLNAFSHLIMLKAQNGKAHAISLLQSNKVHRLEYITLNQPHTCTTITENTSPLSQRSLFLCTKSVTEELSSGGKYLIIDPLQEHTAAWLAGGVSRDVVFDLWRKMMLVNTQRWQTLQLTRKVSNLSLSSAITSCSWCWVEPIGQRFWMVQNQSFQSLGLHK